MSDRLVGIAVRATPNSPSQAFCSDACATCDYYRDSARHLLGWVCSLRDAFAALCTRGRAPTRPF